MRETKDIETQAIQSRAAISIWRSKSSQQETSKIGQKLSPERMRIVIEALREYPILARAAAKAGIHRKTLAYWLKCSEAGQDGYDIEWEGFQWRFHEACEAAIDEAHQRLLDRYVRYCHGPRYLQDRPSTWWSLGNRGADAYARDENGKFIAEDRGPGNVKMLEFLLQLLRPEKWGKPRKRKSFRSGGVLVIGERPSTGPKKIAPQASKPGKWKSASRMVGETKANET